MGYNFGMLFYSESNDHLNFSIASTVIETFTENARNHKFKKTVMFFKIIDLSIPAIGDFLRFLMQNKYKRVNSF